MTHASRVLACMLIGLVAATLSAAPPPQVTLLGSDPAATQPAALPTTPGHHKLRFTAVVDGRYRDASGQIAAKAEPITMSFLLYLPRTYDHKTPQPMLVFLNGAGECGSDLSAIFTHGPSAELERNQGWKETFPLIVLSPQCPGGMRWDSPCLKEAVAMCVAEVSRLWRVDKQRVYMTGLSMGGKGTWLVAMEAPQLFAAIAPISAVDVEVALAAQRLRGVTVWIIVGANDAGFTEGSRRMAAELTRNGIDTILTSVPDSGHDTWGRYYPKRQFYDWFLFHRKGQPPDKARFDDRMLLAIANAPAEDAAFRKRLEADLQKFLPWWHIPNCGRDAQAGLLAEWKGRKNVFVTAPVTPEIPAMLQITQEVPRMKRTSLKITAGHHPDGQWNLVVRVDSKVVLTRAVGPATSSAGWVEATVDLTPHAGRKILLELLNASAGKPNALGYWGSIVLESK